jgi:transposase
MFMRVSRSIKLDILPCSKNFTSMTVVMPLSRTIPSKMELAVMDMWKASQKSTRKNVPQAAILYDKFHVMRHLGDALDKIRKMEYGRLSGKDRSYIKGQKYTLLSNRENSSAAFSRRLLNCKVI